MSEELTKTQIDKIRLLRINGKSYREIAVKIGCHHTTIGKYCRKHKAAVEPFEQPKEKTFWQKIKALF